MTQIRARLILLVVFVALLAVVWWPQGTIQTQDYLSVRFLDVGQGDAVHIQTPDGVEVIIDGGPDASVLRQLAAGRSWLDRSIDVVVATHPDSDHIGGLVDVLARFDVQTIMQTTAVGESSAAEAFALAVQREGAEVLFAHAGQVIQLGPSTTLHVYAPVTDVSAWPTNAASIMFQLRYGETEFMFTGDAHKGSEDFLLGLWPVESEVLKLGHHGSDTSTSETFLKAVKPEYAVVSAGRDNRYGHPHEEVVERVEAQGVQLISTAEAGTIEFLSDGEVVWVVE